MELERFSLMKHDQVKSLILKVLRAAPNNACPRSSLVSKMAKEKGVANLRGSRRDDYEKKVGLALGALQRTQPPTVEVYNKGARVRLAKRAKKPASPAVAPAIAKNVVQLPIRTTTGGELETYYKCAKCGHRTHVDPKAPELRCGSCHARLYG